MTSDGGGIAFSLLGQVVEEPTGRQFAAVLRERILCCIRTAYVRETHRLYINQCGFG